MKERDEDLIRQYLIGDEEAQTMIFERYKTSVFNYALKILGNRADAEDALGEVFVAVFSRKYRFDVRAKFSTWLYTVAHNVCVSRIRQRGRFVSMWFKNEETQEDEELEIPDSSVLPNEEFENKEVARSVRQAIQKLPGEQKEALILREFQGLSYEEISRVLNCSLEKVKILIYRAREGLRTSLAGVLKE